jgi:hypothetical protein
LWKTYVINHFDEITRNNYDQYEEFHRAALNNRPGFPEEERTRTFRVMLSAILRPDLPEATKQIFVNRIEKAAIVMTDLKADMYSLIHMVMLECARRAFAVQANTETVSLNPPTQFSARLDIAELLSVTWHLHKDTLAAGKFTQWLQFRTTYQRSTRKAIYQDCFAQITYSDCIPISLLCGGMSLDEQYGTSDQRSARDKPS